MKEIWKNILQMQTAFENVDDKEWFFLILYEWFILSLYLDKQSIKDENHLVACPFIARKLNLDKEVRYEGISGYIQTQ